MGRASIKSNDPIPLPHDGPLHYLRLKSTTLHNHLESDGVLEIALEWLTSDKESVLANKTFQSNKEAAKILALVSLLQTATTIKEQLQALQTFRGQCLLPQQKRQDPSLSNESDKPADQEADESSAVDLQFYRSVLYRILLEWFFSYQTPIPLRRAIQANLDGLQNLVQVQSSASIAHVASSGTTYQEIGRQVLRSILVAAPPVQESDKQTSSLSCCWKQPLHSLHEALNYKVTHDLLVIDDADGGNTCTNQQEKDSSDNNQLLLERLLQFLQTYAKHQLQPLTTTKQQQLNGADSDSPSVFIVEQEVSTAMQQSIQWGGIIKTVLADAPSMAVQVVMVSSTDESSTLPNNNDNTTLSFFDSFLWQIMTCRITPSDALSNLGMAYSRVLLLRNPPVLYYSQDGDNDINRVPSHSGGHDDAITGSLARHVYNLTEDQKLPHLIAIAIIQGLAATAPIGVMLQDSRSLLIYFQQLCNEADPEVRLAALKGIHTLISRCLTRVNISQDNQQGTSLFRAREQKAMQHMTDGTLEILLGAWENPPNRRMGNAIPSLFQKLIALMQELGQRPQDNDGVVVPEGSFRDLLLRLLGQPSNRKGKYKALETLLPIVGARQIIALGGRWKLLEALLEGIGDRNSHSAGVIADLWGKILSDLLLDMLVAGATTTGVTDEMDTSEAISSQKTKKSKEMKDFPPDLVQQELQNWWEVWVPSLAAALQSRTASRRRHVASFCLPRIVGMVGGRKKRKEASSTFAFLLKAIQFESISDKIDNGETWTGTDGSHNCASAVDRQLWATLEVIRQAHREKLVDLSPESSSLREIIIACVPLGKLRAALKHFNSVIRLVGFQCIQPVVIVGGMKGLAMIEQESGLWKESFPYATDTDGKEYMSSLLQCLTVMMDRISNEESVATETHQDSGGNISSTAVLHRLLSFVVDFLVFEVAGQAAYPGSICEKEAFTIELLGCITAFSSRDPRFVSKNVAVYERKRRASEENAATKIMEAILSRESLSTLFSLLHSQWDGTRSTSFQLLSRLIFVAQTSKLELAVEFTSAPNRSSMMARGVYLASSPRQRESDTGARVLAFLHFSLLAESSKWAYIKDVVGLLDTRLTAMTVKLASLLSGKIDPQSSDRGTNLPLAHGLVHSLRLIIEQMKQVPSLPPAETDPTSGAICEQIALMFCRAIQVSLSVVADVKEGSVIEGMEEDLMDGTTQEGTPLNVNTGAIGANGTFSSINPTEKEEHERRIAIQRVVMGSWLLTRETCAALASLLTANIFLPSDSLLRKAGGLLISTLISLKHAGAAFAAHRALQQLAEFCFDSADFQKLPSLWANRLLEEISNAESVRDSTLRRSTGYALGFLAIMRSEMSSKVDPRGLCPYILKTLIQLCLPPEKDLLAYFDKLKLPPSFHRSLLVQVGHEANNNNSIKEASYEIRCRVHALNILRLIILDAPLAKEVSPIIGQAIVWAILGYYDSAWTVRNSSTMVFAAAMLRTIDADKNAKITDSTGNNATTAGELFKSYPQLPTFLNAVLSSEASDRTTVADHSMATPPAFPILLLLSRLQPVSISEPESRELTEPFITAVFKTLQHRHHALRTAASLAMTNLCSGPQGSSVSSAQAMVHGYHKLLVDAVAAKEWNEFHGALLGIRALSNRFHEIFSILKESKLQEFFLAIAASAAQRQPWPPICTSIVLDIILTMTPKEEEDPGWTRQIEDICYNIVVSLEQSNSDFAGSSELAITAGQAVCCQLVPQVWNANSSSEVHEKALSKLTTLLTSQCIDVKLYTCKAFKKSIYENIDQLVAEMKGDYIARLHSIVDTLLRVIQSQLYHNDDEGVHPPTLRRLSRCLLECIGGCFRLYNDGKPSGTGFLPASFVERVEAVSKSLIFQDQWLDKDDFRWETSMSGNGVELMAFAVACRLQQQMAGEMNSANLDDLLCKFVAKIQELNDPSLSWRLRHSAAVAVETSRLLPWNSIEEKGKQLQHQVLEEVLIMLQDPDPDVRSAASRAAGALPGRDLDPTSHFPLVSQCVLEQTYQRAYRPGNNMVASEFAFRLLSGVQKRCQGVDAKIALVQRELQNTEFASDLDQLLNVGTERKIFEDEVVNAREEPLLANQLSIYSILHMNLATLPEPVVPVANALIAQCNKVLSSLKTRDGRTQDLLHEVTRSNYIFADMHSLVMASAVIVCLGRGSIGIQELANQVLSQEGEVSKLHPCIKTALQVLATAQSASRADIIQCLFLLPASMRTIK